MKENIPGYPGYHITKDGKVYTHKKILIPISMIS